jgi:hypothetical protein
MMATFREIAARKHPQNSARETLVASLGGDPYERLAELAALGERKAKAAGTAYHMDHMRKVVLAHVAGELAVVHAKEGLSEAKLERLARADDRYRQHIEGTAAAVEESELAQAEYWRLRAELLWDEKAISHYNAMSKLGDPTP